MAEHFLLDDINIYQGSPSDDLVLVNLNENTGLDNVTVYPVPTSNELTVGFGLNATDKTSLTILDITGKPIQTTTINGQVGNNLAILDVSKLAPGSYFVAIATGATTVQKRFVIE